MFVSDRKDRCGVCTGGDCRVRETFEILYLLQNEGDSGCAEHEKHEGELLLGQLEAADYVILLDEKGNEYTSKAFADFLAQKMLTSMKRLVFIIGGPYGFSEEVYKRANMKISLSKMTFSHQMVRMIFTEQLYRAMTILKGEPYHHE